MPKSTKCGFCNTPIKGHKRRMTKTGVPKGSVVAAKIWKNGSKKISTPENC